MKTIKIAMGIALVCSLIVLGTIEAGAYPLQQYSVETNHYAPRLTDGGPFYVAPVTIGSPFATFCLEIQEHIYTGTFWGTNDPYADEGGYDTDIPGDGKDYLSDMTVKLYNYFLDHPTLTSEQVAAIQLAIWRAEQEMNSSYAPQYAPLALLPNDSLKALADEYWDLMEKGYNATREILVLNLYGEPNSQTVNYNRKYQSLLIPVSVAEPGTLLFLGMGLVSLALVRRKR